MRSSPSHLRPSVCSERSHELFPQDSLAFGTEKFKDESMVTSIWTFPAFFFHITETLPSPRPLPALTRPVRPTLSEAVIAQSTACVIDIPISCGGYLKTKTAYRKVVSTEAPKPCSYSSTNWNYIECYTRSHDQLKTLVELLPLPNSFLFSKWIIRWATAAHI